MILGIGTDIVDLDRIAKAVERHGNRFATRCFSQAEQELAMGRIATNQHIRTYATRWAAKEACAKALGIGFRDGLYLRDISTVSGAYGKPQMTLHGKAYQMYQTMIPDDMQGRIHVSLSDEKNTVMAFVIIEAV